MPSTKIAPTCLLALAVGMGPASTMADSKATPAEAAAMVKKGVAAIHAGAQNRDSDHARLFAQITAQDSEWVDSDLYLVIYGLDGSVKAHGANAKLVGSNLINMLDIDGKRYVKERMELARSKGAFWQDYKFTNPTNKKIESKSMYCERVDELVACAGIYK